MLRRAVLLLVAGALLGAASGCSGGSSEEPSAGSSTSPGLAPPTSGRTVPCAYATAGPGSKPVEPPPSRAPAQGEVTVTLSTSAGEVPITLERDRTPCAVNSFVSLAQQGFFDDTPCHRLTTQKTFFLQCGDPWGSGFGGPGYTFRDELSGKESYPAGTVPRANNGPDSNGSQFYLVYEDSPLPADYDVIGHMDRTGIETVIKVASTGTDNVLGAGDGHPTTPVTIDSVTVS